MLSMFLLYLGVLFSIWGAMERVNGNIRRENAKLFKAMVYMKYRDLPFTVFEVREIYKEECKKHGFDEV